MRDAEGLIALLDRFRIGMVTFRDGEVTWLWVDPDHRDEGIEEALLREVP